MKKYIAYLFFMVIISSCSSPKTPAEKVALAYCNCAEDYELEDYLNILKSNDQKKINRNYKAMSKTRSNLKKCANDKADVKKSINISEKEIRDAMEKQCPEVFNFFESRVFKKSKI